MFDTPLFLLYNSNKRYGLIQYKENKQNERKRKC